MGVDAEWKKIFQQGQLEGYMGLALLFGFFILLFACAVYLFFRAIKRKYLREKKMLYERHEERIDRAKREHLEEMGKAQNALLLFKERLKEVKKGFEGQLQELKKKGLAAKLVEKMVVDALKNQLRLLKKEEIKRVACFEREIEELKLEIQKMREEHLKQQEQAEMQICDLKRQIRVLIDRM